MPRVIRRQSTYQRVSSYLNPLDHLLRLATDYEAFDWDNWQNTWGTPLGIILNVSCLIARGQADKFRRASVDDVFRRTSRSSSMAAGLSYFLWLSSWALAAFSVGNAVYCFTRKKRYRLFESNIEIEPATPSARRVPVDSSPVANSPMRVLGSMIEPFRSGDASSRAHPSETRDVWEVGVWDPTPLSLHLFAIFSPIHVAIYFLSLPISSSGQLSSPIIGYEGGGGSGTSSAAVYFTVILTQILLSLQIIFVKGSFIQQAHDHRIISKEVMHEYDAKYVHPRLNVRRRDVAVQCSPSNETRDSIQVFTPQFNRSSFRTFANPNYSDMTQPSASKVPPSSVRTAPHVRQSQFERVTGSASGLRKSMANAGMQVGENDARSSSSNSSSSGSSSRHVGDHAGYDQPATTTRRMGTEGLVDWSRHNSRGLSPSKMSTPIRKGSSIRGSTYAESLGTPLGTPIRRRQF